MDGDATPEVQDPPQREEIEIEEPEPSQEVPKMEESPEEIMNKMSSWKFHQILNQLQEQNLFQISLLNEEQQRFEKQ